MATIGSSPSTDRPGRSGLLFDLDEIDLSQRLLGRKELLRWNPHRGDMALLDHVVWSDDNFMRGVGLKEVRDDEFWVAGHFPGQPMYPGVLQVETGAQLACYLFNASLGQPMIAAFLRMESASFRHKVVPGDDLYLLCQSIKRGRRNFTCDVQGLVHDTLAFEVRISGMTLGPANWAVES